MSVLSTPVYRRGFLMSLVGGAGYSTLLGTVPNHTAKR
jgi:hypothetical protein